MDKLQKIALNYKEILNMRYYFEIAKKQNMQIFNLTFEKTDFFHLAGLHKLTDIAAVQSEPNKEIVFNNIINGSISHDLIQHSRFYSSIHNRLSYLGDIGKILDSNQIVFKYLSKSNRLSRIEADYLLENAHETDIIYIFLNERVKVDKGNIPIMCCRSFFPMCQLDYTKNQPSYTLLKKIRIDTVTGERVVQYDRRKILDQAKAAPSETERRSILAQLNEKRAQVAIRNVLEGKQELRKDKQEHAR